MMGEHEVLKKDSLVKFLCHEELPCFTQCCRDVNIYLTPYDVLRMRGFLGMGSQEFLQKYTQSFLAKVTHIPVVQLLMNKEDLYCPFVTPGGCKIYDARPWACRMYPFDLDVKNPGCYRPMVSSSKCMGLREPKEWMLEEWFRSQGLEPYMEMEELYQSVMPSEFSPGSEMDAGLGKLLFLAYDLDVFSEMLKDESFRKLNDIGEGAYREASDDDEALLRLAFSYIKSQLRELYPLM